MCRDEDHPLFARRILVGAVIVISLSILTFHASASPLPAPSHSLWYVAPGGDDGNSCQDQAQPCATINAAIAKASSGDTVNVAMGTYIAGSDSEEVVLLDKDALLLGGYDDSFTFQTGLSTIDGQGSRRGMTVEGGVTALVYGFAIQSGFNEGVLVSGTLTMTGATINNNDGSGIRFNSPGLLVLRNSTIDHNSGFGVEIDSGAVVAVNSTLSGNIGGGISIETGSLSSFNSTVSDNGNPAGTGGGIRLGSGSAHLANTILANNLAATGPDCHQVTGELISDGYNLIGDTTGCAYTPATGDLIDTNPRLGPLHDNGGPTLTHRLLAASPAIDAGDPAACVDHLGDRLTTDQRGSPRTNRCDMGSYERQAESSHVHLYLPCVYFDCPKLYFDDFNNPASGWPVENVTDHRLEYLDDEYRILVKYANWFVVSGPGYKASDFILEVDGRNVSSVEGEYGFMFGLSDDFSQFYTASISSAGEYKIWKFDGSGSQWTLLASGTSTYIRPGTVSNQIRLKRSGSEISMVANGGLLVSIHDNSFTGLRYIGLAASSSNDPDVDIRFDNFSVYPVNCQASGNATMMGATGFHFGGTLVAKQK